MVVYYSYLHFLGFEHKHLRKIDGSLTGVPVDQCTLSELTRLAGVTDQRKVKIVQTQSEYSYERYGVMLERSGAQVIASGDTRFPARLRETPNPPFLIYVLGELPTNQELLSVVGSREYTSYGESVVQAFLPEFVQAGVGIVSGGALGIDGIAHEVAVRSGGYTIAILGGGIDQLYPRSHEGLFRAIVEHKGAVVSHFPIGTTPVAYNFPIRNELVAGISRGTLVIEARSRSGSLITAGLALDMGRDVFAVPSDIGRRNSAGTNELIRSNGAKLVMKAGDILEDWGMLHESHEQQTLAIHQLAKNPLHALVFERVSHEPVHPNTLAEQTGLDISTILVTLTELEIQGFVGANIDGTYTPSIGKK